VIITETTPAQSSAAVEYIKLVHKSESDLICFGFLNSETKQFQQAFRSLEDAVQPQFLEKLQNANQVNSVYMSLNSFKSPQRTKANVASIRSVGLDLDKDGRANLNRLFESKLVVEPTIVFETSPGKFQAVWTVEDMSVDQAERISKALAAEFGGDPAATDAARVMRLPGFKNCKYSEKPEVEIVHLADRKARLTAIDFKLLLDKSAVTPAKSETITSILKGKNPIPWGYHDDVITAYCGKLRQDGLELPEIESAAIRFCEERIPSRGSDWIQMVQKCAKSVCRYPAGDPTPTVLIGGRLPGQGVISASSAPEVFEWSEVEPLDDQLQPVAPFKPEFLPDAIRPWVVDVSERMSVPLDFTGICALTTIAGVIGRRVFVCPKAKDKEWKESVALSGAVVAESGKTKTPTWKTFTNIAVEKEADWQEDHKKKTAKYAEDSKAWEALDKRNKETEKKTGVAQNTQPAPEEPTPSRRLLLNDATPEKMHDVMKSNPCGLFYLRDELSSWVAEFDKEGREVQRGMFLAAMNGNDPYTVDRIGREGGSATMCVSVFGGFQPDMFRDFLNNSTNVSDGTIPRFPLLVWPDESDLPIIDRTANDSAKQQFRRVIRELAEMNEKQILIHFSPEAQPVFDSWLVSLNQKIHAEENSGKRSHLSKYKGALPKIAALLQIVDLVSNGPLAGTHVIDLAHINKAIDLLAYLETHMHRIYGCIQNPIQKAESAIAEHLKQGDLNSGFTIRTIQRKCWRNLSKSEYIDLALETLVEKGWLRPFATPTGPQGGRPTTMWEINPALIGGKV
jgi:hypothetical protein